MHAVAEASLQVNWHAKMAAKQTGMSFNLARNRRKPIPPEKLASS